MDDLIGPRRVRNVSGYPRPDLVAYIDGQCVYVPVDRDILPMIGWCAEHAGEQRPWHPMGEAEQGWLDYFDGDWAVDHDYHDEDYHSFWFASKNVRTMFSLIWACD
jgi:hypothetical protein